MGASVRVEAFVLTDPRYTWLADLCNSSNDAMLGKMIAIWMHCTEKQVYVLRGEVIKALSGIDGFADKLVQVGLAEDTADNDYRIKGTAGRIEWLGNLRKNSRAGGQARARQKPDTSAPTPIPTPTPTKEILCAAEAAPRGPESEPRAPRTPEQEQAAELVRTQRAAELVAIRAAVDYLNTKAGRAFEVNDTLVRQVRSLFKRGYTPRDVKLVIWHRAKEWLGDPKMAPFLRPKTLFSATNFDNYIADARQAAGGDEQ